MWPLTIRVADATITLEALNVRRDATTGQRWQYCRYTIAIDGVGSYDADDLTMPAPIAKLTANDVRGYLRCLIIYLLCDGARHARRTEGHETNPPIVADGPILAWCHANESALWDAREALTSTGH